VTHGIDWKYIEYRQKQIIRVLKQKKESLKNFEANMTKLETVLSHDVPNDLARNKFHGLALFISEPKGYFKALGLPHDINNNLVVDTSPYIRPLARLLDEWEEYAIILLNNNEAKMYVVTLGAIKDKERLTAHIMNKHKKGGWSQMRFQRLRKEAIDRFHKKVAEELGRFIEDDQIVGIILAGPGEAKDHFKNELSHNLKELIIGEFDYEMDIPTETLIETASEEVAKLERQTSEHAVDKLKNEILKGGKAVFGTKETSNAASYGKVELLILSKDYQPRGWICEHCQVVETGVKTSCPYCNHETSEVDVLEEILEFAQRTGANIEFVGDNPILEELGGVGALLRY
jgi:peptide chain release factor subunit 1